jgi:hypothetical protein
MLLRFPASRSNHVCQRYEVFARANIRMNNHVCKEEKTLNNAQ